MSVFRSTLLGGRGLPVLNRLFLRPMYNRSTENTTFHPRDLRIEPEEEYEAFKAFDKDLGHLIPETVLPERGYEASSADWASVSRLTEGTSIIIPSPPPKEHYASGYWTPTAKFGDFRFHISRTSSHMLPVYLRRLTKHQLLETRIRRIDGDLFAFKEEFDAFLFDKYRMQFISQVAELYGRVTYRGDFLVDAKEFCKLKGF
uniref:Large ribosomal subunit protein mL49 n=1 Tax=Caligus rogercresseyi TaxID=217165 RepID=C1BPE3_CALRO|nr:Probable mitochondrial 39S ribosomal protein L49 [Caligus rogercresseyi]